MKRAKITLLGHVVEELKNQDGEDPQIQVHLVYRLEMNVQDNYVEMVEVMTLRRGGKDDRFYLRVEPKAKAMVNSLLNHYENRR